MRTLLLLSLSSAVFCSAQDVGHQANRLPSQDADRSSINMLANADMRATGVLVASATSATSSSAENLAVTDPAEIVPVQPDVPLEKSKISKNTGWKSKRWLSLTLAQHGSAAFDAWSTRQALGSGNGYERDPLLRPFAKSAAIYPALQVLPFGLDYLSSRMVRSQNTIVRRFWWLPQTVSTVGFVWTGARNLHVANVR